MSDRSNQSNQANRERQQQRIKLGECEKHGLLIKITIRTKIAVDFALRFNESAQEEASYLVLEKEISILPKDNLRYVLQAGGGRHTNQPEGG